MTWHLKDRELEKKLIAIDCKFLTELNETVKEKINEFSSDSLEEGDLITLMFCRDSQIELGKLYFLFSELEEVPEYNPKAWNEYPKVIPPKNVVMRCEIYTERYDTDTPEPKGGKLIERTSGVFDGFKWNLYSLSLSISENWTIRYRPWDED